MKILLFFSFLTISTGIFAQFTVAPFGSTNSGAPPVGEDRRSQCGAKGCLEFNIKPYCFGTNLRAYSFEKQLAPNEDISMNVTFTDPNDQNQKDTYEVVFPASMSYRSASIRSDCSILNPTATGMTRNIECNLPDLNLGVIYKLDEWKFRKNSRCTSGPRQEYCEYGSIQMEADRESDVNSVLNIKCLYLFTKDYKINPNVVSCEIPTKSDYSSKVKIYDSANQDITSSVQVNAFTNNLNFIISKGMKSRSRPQVIKHGTVLPSAPPKHKIAYKQGSRSITALIESEKFDEANANNSFTTIVKFPGQEGFCGGYYSPLMLFFDNKVPRFDGISTFPLYGIKDGGRVYWPEENSPGHFLVRLNNISEPVTSYLQLFGRDDKNENGFEALSQHDLNKDGVIDSKDPIFNSLFLWRDSNSNGLTDKGEVLALQKKKIISIDLKYDSKDMSNFESRARAREKGVFNFKGSKGKVVKGKVYDVWFAPID